MWRNITRSNLYTDSSATGGQGALARTAIHASLFIKTKYKHKSKICGALWRSVPIKSYNAPQTSKFVSRIALPMRLSAKLHGTGLNITSSRPVRLEEIFYINLTCGHPLRCFLVFQVTPDSRHRHVAQPLPESRQHASSLNEQFKRTGPHS
jgi:hypothetical protein